MNTGSIPASGSLDPEIPDSEIRLHERRLLALCLHLECRPYDPSSGEALRLTPDTLRRQCAEFFHSEPDETGQTELDEDGSPYTAAWATLVDRDWLRSLDEQDDAYQLTAGGRHLARRFHRRLLARGFGELQVHAAGSATYRQFCEIAMDVAAGQYSPVDAIQLHLVRSALVSALPEDGPEDGRLLDLGCGAGSLTAWLVEGLPKDSLRGVQAYGIDIAQQSIELGQRRLREQDLQHLSDRLSLHVADLHDLRLPPASFDVLLCIDTLANLDTPGQALESWLPLLRPAGRLIVLGSEQVTVTSPAVTSPPTASPAVTSPAASSPLATSPLATAPPARLPRWVQDSPILSGWRATSINLSALEPRLWQRQVETLESLASEFEAEGNLPLHRLLLQEARRCGSWQAEGRSRRWLSVVRRPA